MPSADAIPEELEAHFMHWPDAFAAKDVEWLKTRSRADAFFTYPDGAVHDREEHLRTSRETDLEEHDLFHVEARRYAEDVVVVSGRHTLKAHLTGDHIDPELKRAALEGSIIAFTQVWVRQDGEWQLVSQDAHIAAEPADAPGAAS